MIYLRYRVLKAQPTSGSDGFAGAFVNCWINIDSVLHAQANAEEVIAREGWRVVEIEEATAVDFERYVGTNAEQYFLQARSEGSSYVFHTWPEDAPDARHADHFQQDA